MEVLKTYKPKHETGLLYTVYGINDQGWAICEIVWGGGYRELARINPKDFVNFEEYKPPRKGTVWVNIYPRNIQAIHLSRAAADRSCMVDRIACIEVPWIEGQGLDRDSNHTHDCGCGKCNNDKYNCI